MISFVSAFSDDINLFAVPSFNSFNNSTLNSEKLFTKFNGFCISCAMPAVSSPNDAIFSDWINCDCVDLSSVKVVSTFSFSSCNSCVRLTTFSSNKIFSFFNVLTRHLIKIHNAVKNTRIYSEYAHHVRCQGGNTLKEYSTGSLQTPSGLWAFNLKVYLPSRILPNTAVV